ncbi:MAG: hypothetical protein NZT92_09210 [Abditibacteriales bacterium]|nr:hypothetical protein [Abditibacteriales bacterium]MDW8364561.1 hypothetical protein [Abditibacteriales bacterium]
MAQKKSGMNQKGKGASPKTTAKATITLDKREATRLLRGVYEQHGYIRLKVDTRRQVSHSWEIRLWANSADEARQLAAALTALDLTSGKPFAKRKGFIVPLYGKDQVAQFLKRVKPKVKNQIPEPTA